MVNVHAPVPEHAPDQPANVEVLSGVAVNVILLPCANCGVDPQAAPAGLDETVPKPPDVLHVIVSCTGGAGFTVIVTGVQANFPARSTAHTPNVYVPAVPGVPEMTPLRFMTMPLGGVPLASVSS